MTLLKKLSAKSHTLKVSVLDGEVKTTFNVIKNNTTNPDTGDNIILYVSLLGVSIASLIGITIYSKKKLYN